MNGGTPLFHSLFSSAFPWWQSGLAHSLINPAILMIDSSDRCHLPALIEVASKIPRGRLNSKPATDKLQIDSAHTPPQPVRPGRVNQPVFLVRTTKMPTVKVAKLMDKSRVLLFAGLAGIEQQFIAHWNGVAFPPEEWSSGKVKYVRVFVGPIWPAY